MGQQDAKIDELRERRIKWTTGRIKWTTDGQTNGRIKESDDRENLADCKSTKAGKKKLRVGSIARSQTTRRKDDGNVAQRDLERKKGRKRERKEGRKKE